MSWQIASAGAAIGVTISSAVLDIKEMGKGEELTLASAPGDTIVRLSRLCAADVTRKALIAWVSVELADGFTAAVLGMRS
jgi:hypothetical protein